MINNRMTEGVGKKIVEALKMQSDVEITPETKSFEQAEEPVIADQDDFEEVNFDDNDELNFEEEIPVQNEVQDIVEPQPAVIPQPQINIQQQYTQPAVESFDDFEVPNNVAVLRQLITKLPAGVTKQTGALIIKQTMEALGISMKSVLQEAQQVQEGLNNSSRECQASIAEYKRQIGILEKQAQKYQRQYASLNDIISLFIQTNI